VDGVGTIMGGYGRRGGGYFNREWGCGPMVFRYWSRETDYSGIRGYREGIRWDLSWVL